MRLLGRLKDDQNGDTCIDQDDDGEENILLQNCGNRGSIRSLGRVGGRWWMRSLRLPSNHTYRSMAFSELRAAAESVLRDERPRFATRSMLIKLLEDASTSGDEEAAISVPRPLPSPPRTSSPVAPGSFE